MTGEAISPHTAVDRDMVEAEAAAAAPTTIDGAVVVTTDEEGTVEEEEAMEVMEEATATTVENRLLIGEETGIRFRETTTETGAWALDRSETISPACSIREPPIPK